ncbi:hypothetical protein T492DRAFT_1117525 [Pavlovales sp. CCMP2436]|nr:hypothetical protein T492DRAFT_1117525 [Pavlovales sp. CCMP2436]
MSEPDTIPETGDPETPHLGAEPPSDPNTDNTNVAFAPREDLPIQSPVAALELGQITPPVPGSHAAPFVFREQQQQLQPPPPPPPRWAPASSANLPDPRQNLPDLRQNLPEHSPYIFNNEITPNKFKNLKNLLENATFAQQQHFITTALFHGKAALSAATGVNDWEHAGFEDMKTRDFHSLLTATSAGLVQTATLSGVITSNIIAMLQNSDPGAHHAIFAAAVIALFSNTYMKSAAILAAVIAGLDGGPLEFKSMVSICEYLVLTNSERDDNDTTEHIKIARTAQINFSAAILPQISAYRIASE